MVRGYVMAASCLLFAVAAAWRGPEPEARERGEKALTGRALNPPAWSGRAYKNLWRRWDDQAQQRPADYAQAIRERYGLHPAPYANGEYPMGLRPASNLLISKGVTTDCMICH